MIPSSRITNLAELIVSLGIERPKVIHSKETVSSAIAQLQENNFGVLRIEDDLDEEKISSSSRPLIFSGYSIISKLVELRPSRYRVFLDEPCVEGALAVGTIGDKSDLQSLCHVFESTTLGYALVHDYEKNISNGSIVTVKDLLKMYQKKFISSRLSVNDVASTPMFALSRGTRLDRTLAEMVRRKFRRVQILGTRLLVSDSQILAYLFGEERMRKISKKPERLLDGILEEVKSIEPPWVNGNSNLFDAAILLISKMFDCAMSDGGLVTPWDLIVKPWRLGELRIA